MKFFSLDFKVLREEKKIKVETFRLDTPCQLCAKHGREKQEKAIIKHVEKTIRDLSLFLPPSVRREVKGLSELLLRHFSVILIFWKIFNVNTDFASLVMSVFEP